MILINISNKNYNHCHFLSAYQAPGTVLEALMCTVTIPILQMSTLRHREFKPLTKLTQLLSRPAGVQVHAAWLCHLCSDHHANYPKTCKWLLLLA